MIASFFILFACLAALAEFAVGYSRSVIASYSEVEISQRTRSLAGITSGNLRHSDFPVLIALLRECPQRGADFAQMLAVRAYYLFLTPVRRLSGMLPEFHGVVLREQASCAHFVAAILDRCAGAKA